MKDAPVERLRYLHVKVHLMAIQKQDFPTRSLDILQHYESRNIPAPQMAYGRVIGHLFATRRTASYAHAWDLFAHMRFAAHPDPDAPMYARMIRGCASHMLSPRAQPERALDLFTEMTVDKQIPPTAETYTATILACARSGERDFIHHAFQLAKQMLDAHRDARGAGRFAPDRTLYAALIQGAKRIGDITRTRWLLAELVKEHRLKVERGDPDADKMAVTEEIMVHVFHAYAAYRPPFRRSLTVVQDSPGALLEAVDDTNPQQPSLASETGPKTPVPSNARPTFSSLPPQTHEDTLREVVALFHRIVEEGKLRDSNPLPSFSHVNVSSYLVNGYISAHYTHAPFGDGLDLFMTLYEELGVSRNAHSYLDALNACAFAQKGDRKLALSRAQAIWKKWELVEAAWRNNPDDFPNWTTRAVERAYGAMIRVYAL